MKHFGKGHFKVEFWKTGIKIFPRIFALVNLHEFCSVPQLHSWGLPSPGLATLMRRRRGGGRQLRLPDQLGPGCQPLRFTHLAYASCQMNVYNTAASETSQTPNDPTTTQRRKGQDRCTSLKPGLVHPLSFHPWPHGSGLVSALACFRGISPSELRFWLLLIFFLSFFFFCKLEHQTQIKVFLPTGAVAPLGFRHLEFWGLEPWSK